MGWDYNVTVCMCIIMRRFEFSAKLAEVFWNLVIIMHIL